MSYNFRSLSNWESLPESPSPTPRQSCSPCSDFSLFALWSSQLLQHSTLPTHAELKLTWWFGFGYEPKILPCTTERSAAAQHRRAATAEPHEENKTPSRIKALLYLQRAKNPTPNERHLMIRSYLKFPKPRAGVREPRVRAGAGLGAAAAEPRERHGRAGEAGPAAARSCPGQPRSANQPSSAPTAEPGAALPPGSTGAQTPVPPFSRPAAQGLPRRGAPRCSRVPAGMEQPSPARPAASPRRSRRPLRPRQPRKFPDVSAGGRARTPPAAGLAAAGPGPAAAPGLPLPPAGTAPLRAGTHGLRSRQRLRMSGTQLGNRTPQGSVSWRSDSGHTRTALGSKWNFVG